MCIRDRVGIITGASVGSEAAISVSVSVELLSTILSSSGLTAAGGGGGGRGDVYKRQM